MTENTLIFQLICLWRKLGFRRQKQFLLLMFFSLVSALIDVFSLGAVLPFLAVMSAPESLMSYKIIINLMIYFGFTSANQLALPFTILFIVSALFAAAIRIVLLKLNTRFAFSCGADISFEIYRKTLYQPYKVHLNRNSSTVISGVINKVNSTVFEILLPILSLFSNAVLVIAISIALIAIDPKVALAATGGFCICYAIVTILFRNRLRLNSQRIAVEQTKVIKVLQEGLGGIRDVLLDGTQFIFCEIYRLADRPLRLAQGNNIFMGQSPRHAMEALGIALIALIALFLSFRGGVASALPVLGALALGAQRLLPSLQYCYSSWASIVGNQALLIEALNLLNQPVSNELLIPDQLPMIIKDTISLNDIRFQYFSNGPWVIDGINTQIKKGARIGIVGSTGSGKSTLVDLFMGLLSPTEGTVSVDGFPIDTKNLRAWQKTVAHVPQTVYLADSSIAENIAFGVPLKDIDMDLVKKVARQAMIASFIEAGVDGYNGFVGERGVRLSGGQRQRIGIARALYKKASVLVFDEATSALDNTTEQLVMSSIDELSRDLTIIIIAHRITTVQHCDQIIELNKGKIVAQGSYDQLIELSTSFRQMAFIGKAG
jgi:ABC-type multidrug transport system fused ATPase/permease subunit